MKIILWEDREKTGFWSGSLRTDPILSPIAFHGIDGLGTGPGGPSAWLHPKPLSASRISSSSCSSSTKVAARSDSLWYIPFSGLCTGGDGFSPRGQIGLRNPSLFPLLNCGLYEFENVMQEGPRDSVNEIAMQKGEFSIDFPSLTCPYLTAWDEIDHRHMLFDSSAQSCEEEPSKMQRRWNHSWISYLYSCLSNICMIVIYSLNSSKDYCDDDASKKQSR